VHHHVEHDTQRKDAETAELHVAQLIVGQAPERPAIGGRRSRKVQLERCSEPPEHAEDNQ
jgi:hypothetical protein